MKSLFIGLALLACTTSAQAAEKWTCSHSAIIDPMSVVVPALDKPEISRFELSPPLAVAVIWAAPEPFSGQAVHGTCLKD